MNIRHRATEISELVENPHRLEEERQKAAENKAKYTGVSASQMRTGTTGFGNSTRSGGFHSSSLTRPGEGSAPRAQSFRAQASANPSSFSLGGNTREGSGISPSMSKSVSSTRQEEDISPVRATQARIAKLALSSPSAEDTSSKRTPKKKLSDVKANPKIAASLGLKMPVAPSTGAASSRGTEEKPSHDDNPLDLLSTLDFPAATDQESIQADNATRKPSWDPFGGADNSSAHVALTAPEPKKIEESAPLPEDIFASLSNDVPQSTVVPQNPPVKKEVEEDVFDPFKTGVATQQVQPTPTDSEKKDPFADLLS